MKIPKPSGQKAISLATKMKLLDSNLEIQKDEKYLYLPLVHKPSTAFLTLKNQLADAQLQTGLFKEKAQKGTTIFKLLEKKMPPDLFARLPHSADTIGDIVIVEIDQSLDGYKTAIGEAFLEANKNVKTVLAKEGTIQGKYRLRKLTTIAGLPKTSTIHKEYGCRFYVDVAKAYFSPRLSNEHRRIASLIKEEQTVVDLFAGVGPFAIQIAKIRERATVFAIDVNPDAIEFLKRNVRLNNVVGKVRPILGDSRGVVKQRLAGTADHVIMNLPEQAVKFVDVACLALKKAGGIVHFYGFTSVPKPIEKVQLCFVKEVEKCGRTVGDILVAKPVRATAPHECQIVIDAEVI